MSATLKPMGTVNVINAIDIELYTGDAALTFLTKDSTAKSWATLYNICPWTTVFQSHAFVLTWYQIYQKAYLPIVVVGCTAGRFTGMLALAFDYRKEIIIGAGGYVAEDVSLLAEPSNPEGFIKMALLKVQGQFPHISILLCFLSSQVPLQWTNEPYWRDRCVLQISSCPLMEMSKISANEMVHKTGFRSKLNKLKRLGVIEFERIKNSSQFSNIFNELITLYDFRQGARFNLSQFKTDPLKKDLYEALFQQELLHVTVLKVKGRIFAAVIAIGGQDSLHLNGMIVHAPFYAKYCSPGFLHLVLLTLQLEKEGVSLFDLSPGGDFYKSRMATKQASVYELVITDHIGYRVKRHLRKSVYNILLKTGNWPMGVQLAFKKRLYLLKAKMLQLKKQGKRAITGKVDPFFYLSKRVVYELQPSKDLANSIIFPFNRNNLQDLLCYEEKNNPKSRWEFLEEAMQRFEIGQTSYTFCEGGVLLACIWLDSRVGSMPLGLAISNKAQPSYILQGFYCYALGKQYWPEFVAAVVASVGADAPFAPVQAYVSSNDQALCHILKGIGFQKTCTQSTGLVC